MRRGFDLNLLRPLDALLRERSVTEAARLSDVSQPAMSGMLSRLRDHFQDPLLVKIGRNMELTPRAQSMLEEVHQTLLRIDQLTQPLADFDPFTVKRHFRIMTSEFGLFLILPSLFRLAEASTPGVTFETVSIDQPAASIYSGAVDLCLTGDTLAEVVGDMASVVCTQKLMEEKFVGLVDAAHPLSGAVSLDSLIAYPHVATQFPSSRFTVEDIGFSGMSERHPPRVRVASFLAIGRIVAGTCAIGVLPERLARLVEAGLGLRTIEVPAEFSGIAIRMLWHARYNQDKPHRWLRNLVVETCSGLQACLPKKA